MYSQNDPWVSFLHPKDNKKVTSVSSDWFSIYIFFTLSTLFEFSRHTFEAFSPCTSSSFNKKEFFSYSFAHLTSSFNFFPSPNIIFTFIIKHYWIIFTIMKHVKTLAHQLSTLAHCQTTCAHDIHFFQFFYDFVHHLFEWFSVLHNRQKHKQ